MLSRNGTHYMQITVHIRQCCDEDSKCIFLCGMWIHGDFLFIL